MGLLRFSYRSEILSLHTNITVTLPSEELTYYPLTDIKREEGVAARRNSRRYICFMVAGMMIPVLSGNQILSVMRKKTV